MAGDGGTEVLEKARKIPALFLALDLLGALLAALGFCELFGSGAWVEELELQRYGLWLVVGGFALMAPLLIRVIHLLLGARGRRQEREGHP